MLSINCPKVHAALSADGANGYITVTSNTDFWPGAHVWLNSSTQDPTEYIISEVTSDNEIGLRPIQPNGGAIYTRADTSIWKVADSATIDQAPQLVQGEENVVKPSRIL